MKAEISTQTGKFKFKNEKEKKILFSLVDHYIQTGKPVGSNTLKETELHDLSSATIRNYFVHLEQAGFLKQQHTSGGRIPTDLAFKFYAQRSIPAANSIVSIPEFEHLRGKETKEIASFLQEAAETLCQLTSNAVFLSAPHFDHDFIIDIKITIIDSKRCVCMLITDFGAIQTEVLYLDKKLTAFMAKKLEDYFRFRLTDKNQPENLSAEEEAFAKKIYNEMMMRYIVNYSNFKFEEVYRTGFSKLLAYPDFHEASSFASALSLFENTRSISLLLKEATKLNTLKFWIGDDLISYVPATPNCAVIVIPYYVNHIPIGSIGILGPTRIPYGKLFQLLSSFSESISQSLTENVYKFKLNFKQPQGSDSFSQNENQQLIGQTRLFLLEDKTVLSEEGTDKTGEKNL